MSNLWDRVKSALRIDRPGPMPGSPAKSLVTGSIDPQVEWIEHPGHSVTPERIATAFLEAERGFPARQCDLFADLIESSAHLRSTLEHRLDAVAGKAWIMQPGGDEDIDHLAARKLQEALEAVPNWSNAIEHLLEFNPYGYAGVEIQWDLKDNWWVPVWFDITPHRRFRFLNDNPRLLTREAPVDGIPLEPGAWIFARRRGPLARSGLMRTAAWWTMFSQWAVRDWVIWMRTFGMALIRGVYDETAQPEDKKVLKQAVKSLGKSGMAVMSKACTIEIDQPQQGGKATDVHGALVQLCNKEISKLIKGATLTMESGTQGGSFAAADIQQDSAFDLIDGDQRRLGRRIGMDLGRAFCHFNGLQAKPPFGLWSVSREIDPKQKMEIAVMAATKLLLPLSKDQLRRDHGFKPPIDDDDALVGAAPGPAPGAPGHVPPAPT